MAILDLIATARDETFAARVAMILMSACINVANEDAGTTNHTNRLALVHKHLKAEINVKAVAAAAIASNGTIQSTIDGAPDQRGANVSDNDLQFVVNGLIDILANAYSVE
jgi:hypothetical protein